MGWHTSGTVVLVLPGMTATLLKPKFPDAGQGPSMQAGRVKDGDLGLAARLSRALFRGV